MKQTLVKNYVYEGYVFIITVILNNILSEETYTHSISAVGKDYLELSECTSETLSETLSKVESNINSFVDKKIGISEEEAFLLENGFVRTSY